MKSVIKCCTFLKIMYLLYFREDCSSIMDVSKANLNFLAKVYSVLMKSAGTENNMVVSPFSISAVMAMALTGARGSTGEQMRSVFSFPDKEKSTVEGYEALLSGLGGAEDVSLDAANSLFVHQSYQILEAYQETLKKYFKATPKNLDFANGEEARSIINKWVEEKTRDKIKELIPSGSISELTKLVLVNAVYFKGNWKDMFEVKETKKEDFTLLDGSKAQVDMMTRKGKYNHAVNNDLGCTILMMPYKGDRLSMLVYLPNDPARFNELEAKFTSLDPADFQMVEREFIVALPKFKIETTHDELVSNLKELGLIDIFEPAKADLSGISGKKDLHVSDIVQKAFIEVNEEGSEAAAATAMMMRVMMMPAPPKKFYCNRPFLFTIRDNESGMMLFAGRVVNPAK